MKFGFFCIAVIEFNVGSDFNLFTVLELYCRGFIVTEPVFTGCFCRHVHTADKKSYNSVTSFFLAGQFIDWYSSAIGNSSTIFCNINIERNFCWKSFYGYTAFTGRNKFWLVYLTFAVTFICNSQTCFLLGKYITITGLFAVTAVINNNRETFYWLAFRSNVFTNLFAARSNNIISKVLTWPSCTITKDIATIIPNPWSVLVKNISHNDQSTLRHFTSFKNGRKSWFVNLHDAGSVVFTSWLSPVKNFCWRTGWRMMAAATADA